MNHFFITKSQLSDNYVTITGPDVNHIKNVLRLKPGEEISASIINYDGETPDTNEYRLGIEEIREDTILCALRFVKESNVELPGHITLFQALPKGDKMEFIIQKCVELGIHEIVPVECEHCVVRLEPSKATKKISRWQGISEAAAKQSKRSNIPLINGLMSFKNALDYAESHNIVLRLFPYELAVDMSETKKLIEGINSDNPASIGVFIGPEGGFSKREVELAKESGWQPITLGKRILRTETAGMTVMSWIMYQLEK